MFSIVLPIHSRIGLRSWSFLVFISRVKLQQIQWICWVLAQCSLDSRQLLGSTSWKGDERASEWHCEFSASDN